LVGFWQWGENLFHSTFGIWMTLMIYGYGAGPRLGRTVASRDRSPGRAVNFDLICVTK
jgi:hypothetical protein